ncbi:MAG TPA: hypothetical protein VNJ54_08290 [Plantibacter sp.]|uniref:hypothetical protein n=1 Tax=Plantibacter sp. TaxID=1871045 RepID=UPI002CEAB365|nr:hypothetical protein [Plantibacter sp.]
MGDDGRRGVRGYLVRTLSLAAATVLLLGVCGVVAALFEVVGTGIRVDRDTGVYGSTAPLAAGTPSEAEIWYQMLGSLGGWLPLALAVMLLLVQPLMELVRRWTPSRGLAYLAGLGAVAIAGICFGLYLVFSAPLATWIGGGTGSAPVAEIGSALSLLVFGLVAYGTPVLIIAALIIGLSLAIDRRRVRSITAGLAGLLVVAVVVAGTGAFRPPPAQDVAAAQRSETVDGFTRALEGIGGIADIEVVGAGATVTMALDAGVGQVLAAADAARQTGEQLQGIAIVVIQREPDPESPAQRQDPPRGPWRVQLVPSDRSVEETTDQLQRLMLTERLQVEIALTDGFPLVTVYSMEALPAAVRELREIYPDGAHYRVEDRFSMTDDPSGLSTPMIEAILDIAAAYPAVEIEVVAQPKLFIADVTPEQAAAIVAILADPALAGTSPSGYPSDYSIDTSGPDEDLEGTFG